MACPHTHTHIECASERGRCVGNKCPGERLPYVRQDSISVPLCGAGSQSQSCSQLIGQIRVAQMAPKWTAAVRERKATDTVGKKIKNKKTETETETKAKPKACPEVSRMDRSKLLENVKNYIICAEKCAYIFSSLFLSAPAPSPSSPSPTFALTIC